MFPVDMKDPEYPTSTGDREDGQNLVEEWLKNKEVISSKGTFDLII